MPIFDYAMHGACLVFRGVGPRGGEGE